MEQLISISLLLFIGIGMGWVARLATYKFLRPVHDFDDAVMDTARNIVRQVETQVLNSWQKLHNAVNAVEQCHPTAKLHDIIMRVVAAVDELKR